MLIISWQVHHYSATTAKLSNWASSKECVPIAAQPFFGVSTTAFFHSGYPLSCPDANWPYSGEKEMQVTMCNKSCYYKHTLTVYNLISYLLSIWQSVTKETQVHKTTAPLQDKSGRCFSSGWFWWTHWRPQFMHFRFCEETVVTQRKVCCFPSNKPWINRDIKGILNKKKKAGDNGISQNEIQKELRRELQRAKDL